jgi:hypothetical protein
MEEGMAKRTWTKEKESNGTVKVTTTKPALGGGTQTDTTIYRPDGTIKTVREVSR